MLYFIYYQPDKVQISDLVNYDVVLTLEIL